jgi:hypothetical protein
MRGARWRRRVHNIYKMMWLAMILAVAMLATFMSRTVSAQQQDLSKVEIKVTKVSGNIYMLEGAGGNIAASAKTAS